MVKKRLLDTDTLSYILKRREPIATKAREFFLNDGEVVISAITYYEILRGLKFSGAAQQEKVFEEFVSVNPILSVDIDVCRRAAEIHTQLRRAGQLIEDADLLIAATALVNDCVLVTNNTSHYERINNLELENWAV
jgi:tRNA(fMet)-specific endonuclease VapC